jgi:hypothetical protein
MKRRAIIAGLIAVAIALGAFVLLGDDRSEPIESSSAESPDPHETVRRREERSRAVIDGETEDERPREARHEEPRREDHRRISGADGGGEVRHSKREGLLERAIGWEKEAVATSTSVHPITATGIRSAVRASVPELRECYEGWLAQNPKIGGRLTVGFTIATDPDDATKGKVTKVELRESDVGHVFMESCVLAVFADLAFEAPKDGTLKVNYPLTFSNDENP